MSAELLRTKLYMPRLRPSLVPRPRLIEKLNAGLSGTVILISAPAGFGKTTLASSWMDGLQSAAEEQKIGSVRQSAAHHFAWLSLDQGDREPVRFLTYLIAALQFIEPQIGQDLLLMLQSTPQSPIQTALTSLLNELLLLEKPFTLVLDDYQTAGVRPINEILTFLLEHAPPQMHLLIITREDPHLPLARLRARGELTEVRARDLRFTASEAAVFLNGTMGLDLTAHEVDALERRTEGWIAGLQLAALALQESPAAQQEGSAAAFVDTLAGSNRFILDYLVEEVLERQPVAVQQFLLRTSILDQLYGPLCDAIMDNPDAHGQEMLAQLESANLFLLPLDKERLWYRYHHLFADLLRARLRNSEPERVSRLYLRAAAWCEQEGQVDEAVGYALASGNFEIAAGLVETYWGEAISRGAIHTLWSWLQALPDDTVRHSAQLSLATCWAHWFEGQMDRITARLEDVERAMGQEAVAGKLSGNKPDGGSAAQAAALRSFVARYHNDFETAVALAEQALALLPADLPPRTNTQLRSILFLALASAYDGSGALEKAAKAYSETIRWSQRSGNFSGVTGITYRLEGLLRLLGRLWEAESVCRAALTRIEEQGMSQLGVAGILHLALGEVLVEQNKLEKAETHIAQGIKLGKWSGRLDAARNAAPGMARLRLAHGDLRGALAAVEEAQAALGDSPSPLALGELLALQARILIRQGDMSHAARCASEALHLAGWDRGLSGELVALAACRVRFAQDAPHEAIPVLTKSIGTAEKAGRWGTAIELRLLRGLALAQQDDRSAANSDLERALTLAAPEGYVRLFLDEGRPMMRLLNQWREQAASNPVSDYAAFLLTQFAAEPHHKSAIPDQVFVSDQLSAHKDHTLLEPLSPRELDVLQIMAQGRTNKEIARQLVISPGTVKAHTASIYRKLNVANRTEAVARARALGILH